jgi:hypothetical protein
MMRWESGERRAIDWFPWAAGLVVLLCLWSGWETYRADELLRERAERVEVTP